MGKIMNTLRRMLFKHAHQYRFSHVDNLANIYDVLKI